MKAGKLRNLIRIERPVEGTPDEHGFRQPTFELVAEAWADVFGLAGSQIEQRGQFAYESSHRIELRFLPNLDPTMRVKFEDTVFNITGIVDPDRRRQRLFLFCAAKV